MWASQYIDREALLATAAAFDVLVQDADCYGRVGFQNIARGGVRETAQSTFGLEPVEDASSLPTQPTNIEIPPGVQVFGVC